VGDVRVSFLRELVRWSPPEPEPIGKQIERMWTPEWQGLVDSWMLYNGHLYTGAYTTTYAGQKAEPVQDSYIGYVQGAYKSNGVIFAVSMARALLFSDVQFKWRRYGSRGGGVDLFGNRELRRLERPWPGGTLQQLLLRAEQDVTNAGTFFLAESEDGERLLRRRPDWCEFILDAPPDEAVESNVIGFKYTVGGPRSGGVSKLYLTANAEGVRADGAYWAPIPDPDAMFRGMSWLSPVIREMQGDRLMTEHKIKFFENAATPNLAVSLKETVTKEQFAGFVQKMNEAAGGPHNSGKTLYLGGGADVTVVGSRLDQLDVRDIQGTGETRICAAGRVPPIIVGLSEGLDAATYSNYGQARRAFGDGWARQQWKSFAGSVEPLLELPTNAAGEPDAELYPDVSEVAFLREDIKELAETQSITMATINAAIAAGWTPESAQNAVLAEDLSLLVHSGLVSVQLQPPGTTAPTETPAPTEEA
jgi:hypothetical protein